VVDLRHPALEANLDLDGAPSSLTLKPDGGELYVTVPDAHGLDIVYTWTMDVAIRLLLGSRRRSCGVGGWRDALCHRRPQPAEWPMWPSERAKPAALVTAGRAPGACILDSERSLLLVADQDSSDIAVIACARELAARCCRLAGGRSRWQ